MSLAEHEDFMKYLSNSAKASITMSLEGKNENEDLDQHAFVLYDGTIVTIERQKNKSEEIYLENPNGIMISCVCKVKVGYKESGHDKEVQFIANSMPDLINKWKTFKNAKAFDKDLVGTILKIDLTEDQENLIVDLEDCTNLLLNLLLDDDIQLGEFKNDRDMSNRYRLINMIINGVGKHLLALGITDKVHIPYLRRNAMGDFIELNEYMDAETFMMM